MFRLRNLSSIINNLGSGGGAYSLRRKVQTGGFVVVGGVGISRVLRLASNLILTRLLMPEVFGLMAAAISVSVLAIMITDIGVQNCVIRSKNAEDPAFLRTAWTIKILRNLIVWLLVMLFAGVIVIMSAFGRFPAESTFADPRLPAVVALTALQLLITAFTSEKASLGRRNLLVGRAVASEIIAQLFAMIVTILGAYFGLGVWALVLGFNARALAALALSYMIFPGPSMRFSWDRAYAGEILHFGKWLILSSFFGFMTNKGDHMIFGWAFDKDQFGLYAVATIWIGAAIFLNETVISRLLYPALSEVMRDRPANLPRAYGQSRMILDIFAVLIVLGGFFFSDIVFGFLYPDAFVGVIYYMKLLLPVVLFAPYRLLSYIILSMGDTKKFTLVSFVTGLATLTLTPAAINLFGAKVGVIVFASINVLSAPILWAIVRKQMPIDWVGETRMIIAAVVLVGLLLGLEPPVS